MSDSNHTDKKKVSDITTEFHLLKKKKTFVVEDEDEYRNLQDTREFRKIETIDGVPVSRFHPKKDFGLTFSQVESRRKQGLTNKSSNKYAKSYLQIVIKNVFTFLNVLLFAILVLLLIAEDRTITDYFFMLIILTNLGIGILQEIRAKKTVDKLSLVAQEPVKVIREGMTADVPAEDIVLDDLIRLSTGKKIITDSVLVEGIVEVNESLLTGESLPVKKTPGDILFAGSFISSGSCLCQAERVGSENYITKLQEKAKKEKKNNSVILKALNVIIGVVSLCVIPFAIYNFLTGWAHIGWVKDWPEIQEIIKKTCSSMIAMIPSGLYLTVSISLTVSVIALASRKALVQDSYSIEMLARTNVLCLDKTGTITDGTMELCEEKEIHVSPYDTNEIVSSLLDAFEEKNQTAQAILKAHQSSHQWKVKDKIPFSSDRKTSAVCFEEAGTYVFGAPEFILEKGNPLIQELSVYTNQGYRVLLLAEAEGIENGNLIGSPLPLRAYIIKDHIRPEAYDTLKWFSENDVEVKIISGDNALTVSEIARQAGVPNAGNYISLEGKTLDEVADAALKYTVFGRVAPEQKAMLVTSLKKAGKTVGMTGDGVNDILALKIADCSIAMASGAEAARNVSSLVLIESNFACLPKVVEEGRRVINNITEVASLFLMKTIFAFLVTLSTFYPFQPSNLLILEMFSSGIPSFLLALLPNNQRIKGGFLKNILSKAVPGGFTYAVGVIVLVSLCKNGAFGVMEEHAATIAGMYITLCSIVTLFFHCLPLNKYRSGIFALMTAGDLIFLFVPFISNHLNYQVYELTSAEGILVAVSTLIGIVVFILAKIGFTHLFRILERKEKQKQ